jgi:hypothetical protein
LPGSIGLSTLVASHPHPPFARFAVRMVISLNALTSSRFKGVLRAFAKQRVAQRLCGLQSLFGDLVMNIKHSRKLAAISGAVAMALASASHAVTFQFGDLLNTSPGIVDPAATFATLDVNQLSGTSFTYSLHANDLNSLFNAGAFIGSMANDLTTDPALPTISNVTGGGVTAVLTDPGGAPGGNWEFRYDFGTGAGDRLTANETVNWTATFTTPVTYTGAMFALHMQGLAQNGVGTGGSGWFIPTPVPEPQTYAMMLAGLGLMGFTLRRRQKRDRK